MPKFKITLYQEIYTDYIVEADDEDKAQDWVLRGEAEEFQDDTVCKESAILKSEEL